MTIRNIYQQDLKKLLILTFPILLTQIFQSGLGLIDTIMAGQVSALDLSGVAIGSGVWLPTFLLAIGVLLATTPLIGESIGQQKFNKIPFITQQSLWLSLIIGLIGFVAVNQLHHFFGVMKVPNNIQPIAKDYLLGISFGLPAVCAYTTLRCYTESLNRPVVITVISFIGLLLNIPLNYAFIHGFLFIPQMGGAGCGYASAVTLWLDLFMLVGYLTLTKREDFVKTRFFWQFIRPQLPQLKKQLLIGVPIGFAVFFEVSAFSLASLIISPLGEIAVASHQVAITVSSQIFMFPFSIAMALTIMVSKRYGEKDKQALKRIKLLGLGLASTIAILGMILTGIFRNVIPSFFTDNAEVMAQASNLLWFAILYQLVDAWQVNFAGILRGLQDTTIPMFITLLSYWGVAIPVGFYLTRYTQLGASGFWLALVIGLTIAGFLLGLRLWQQQKRLKQLWV